MFLTLDPSSLYQMPQAVHSPSGFAARGLDKMSITDKLSVEDSQYYTSEYSVRAALWQQESMCYSCEYQRSSHHLLTTASETCVMIIIVFTFYSI